MRYLTVTKRTLSAKNQALRLCISLKRLIRLALSGSNQQIGRRLPKSVLQKYRASRVKLPRRSIEISRKLLSNQMLMPNQLLIIQVSKLCILNKLLSLNRRRKHRLYKEHSRQLRKNRKSNSTLRKISSSTLRLLRATTTES